MHGYQDRGHGHGTHRVCTEDGVFLPNTAENVEKMVARWNHFEADNPEAVLMEQNRLLKDIALSAVALKISIEHGFDPDLTALSRDLEAYEVRFGGADEE